MFLIGNLIARYLLKEDTNDISINNFHAENNGVSFTSVFTDGNSAAFFDYTKLTNAFLLQI